MTQILNVSASVEARQLTDRIKVAVEGVWELIKQAYTSRAWSVLGYASWDEYCTREFGTSRLRLPREERQEVVSSLRESGLSLRAIASATGNAYRTVQQDAQVMQSESSESEPIDRETGEVYEADDAEHLEEREPAKIIGTDGKQYPQRPESSAHMPSPQTRVPRTDVVAVIGTVMNRAEDAARAADRLTADHVRNKQEQAAKWHRDLSPYVQSLTRLLDTLERAST